mgnify:CR=1 FL=1
MLRISAGGFWALYVFKFPRWFWCKMRTENAALNYTVATTGRSKSGSLKLEFSFTGEKPYVVSISEKAISTLVGYYPFSKLYQSLAYSSFQGSFKNTMLTILFPVSLLIIANLMGRSGCWSHLCPQRCASYAFPGYSFLFFFHVFLFDCTGS